MGFEPEAGWIAPQALERASALPAPFYTSGEAFAAEQRLVLAQSWQLVGSASALAGAGDHIVSEIAGVPVIAVRQEDGALRAFHNVCRHRAGPIATRDGRGAKSLRCKYHGWTYGLGGELRAAPEMDGAAELDPRAVRLPEIAVEVWHGLVFASLAAAPPRRAAQPTGVVPPLAELLAGVESRAGSGALDGLEFESRESFGVDCNWKVYVDNYLEGYHIPHIHPTLNGMLDYRKYATEISRWHSVQSSPIDGAGVYASGEALYFFVYPNTMLNLLPGRLQTNRVVPLGVDRCRVDFDSYYARGRTGAEGTRAKDQEFSAAVQAEDAGICAAVQRGLASGSYVAGRLSPKRESAVHHFHELLRRAWRER